MNKNTKKHIKPYNTLPLYSIFFKKTQKLFNNTVIFQYIRRPKQDKNRTNIRDKKDKKYKNPKNPVNQKIKKTKTHNNYNYKHYKNGDYKNDWKNSKSIWGKLRNK